MKDSDRTGANSDDSSHGWINPVTGIESIAAGALVQVNAWLFPQGGCLAPLGQQRLREQALDAAEKAVSEMPPKEAFDHPLKARRYAVLRCAGILIGELRQEWRLLPLDDSVLANIPEAAPDDYSMWLTSLARGRPAWPLVRAVVAFAGRHRERDRRRGPLRRPRSDGRPGRGGAPTDAAIRQESRPTVLTAPQGGPSAVGWSSSGTPPLAWD